MTLFEDVYDNSHLLVYFEELQQDESDLLDEIADEYELDIYEIMNAE